MAPDYSAKSDASPDTSGFRFVAVLSPAQPRDRASIRLARSHALKHSLKAKRKQLQEKQEHFHNLTPQQIACPTALTPIRQPQRKGLQSPCIAISAEKLDPFDSLAANSVRFQELLGHKAAMQAGEPIFSINSSISFQSFKNVFDTGLDDPALLNAFMLSLVFAVNKGSIDAECLVYKGKTIEYLNKAVQDPDSALKCAMMGAILLLVGFESRLGQLSNVQIHLNGLSQLLQLCKNRNILLSDGIKRAIFWQDLNSAVMIGSKRIISHDTFPELSWRRDPFISCLYTLPPGFLVISDMFDDDVRMVFEDIQAMHASREYYELRNDDALTILQFDNQQASVESRLYDCRKNLAGSNILVECCLSAAYICAFEMYIAIWDSCLIPSYCSAQLLQKLQQAGFGTWAGKEKLLVWLIFVGGAFALQGTASADYLMMANIYRGEIEPYAATWEVVEHCLKSFLWSGQFFQMRCKAFYDDVRLSYDTWLL